MKMIIEKGTAKNKKFKAIFFCLRSMYFIHLFI